MSGIERDPPPGAQPLSAPLAEPGWQAVDKLALDQFSAADWALLDRQRRPFYAERQAARVLAMLALEAPDPTFGYRINNYQHCLQSATMAWRAGEDEETVAVALLHDIGFTACPSTHGAFAAALLGPYVAERHRWMLERHPVFQLVHCPEFPRGDPRERERWRGHPHFEWTAAFVARYDQNAIDPAYPTAPLTFFAPLVHRLFARPPQPVPID